MEGKLKTRISVDFCTGLTFSFIILKLFEVIDWSWLWVLSPIWIPLGICISILLFSFILIFIAMIIRK